RRLSITLSFCLLGFSEKSMRHREPPSVSERVRRYADGGCGLAALPLRAVDFLERFAYELRTELRAELDNRLAHREALLDNRAHHRGYLLRRSAHDHGVDLIRLKLGGRNAIYCGLWN